MKTYISVGIGDMVLLDSLLTAAEKSAISEIYWACRFGKHLIPLLMDNPDYPNVTKQYIIDDEVGKRAMASLDPVAIEFWHFRPDIKRNFQTGLSLFNLEESFKNNELFAINAAHLFYNSDRNYQGSSFAKYAKPTPYGDHILFHYPTSTRPRSDIATISSQDWEFVENLSKRSQLKVVVISDKMINVPLSNYELLVNPDIRFIVDLAASCTYYAGCDSFCSHLATKVLPKDRLFIKSHEQNIAQKLLSTAFSRCFMPHPPEDIVSFYKPYLG